MTYEWYWHTQTLVPCAEPTYITMVQVPMYIEDFEGNVYEYGWLWL